MTRKPFQQDESSAKKLKMMVPLCAIVQDWLQRNNTKLPHSITEMSLNQLLRTNHFNFYLHPWCRESTAKCEKCEKCIFVWHFKRKIYVKKPEGVQLSKEGEKCFSISIRKAPHELK